MSNRQKSDKLPKYLEAAKLSFKSLSNLEILSEVISLSSGDDYDGCFTTRGGAAIYNAAKEELKDRLVKSGFIVEADKI